MRCLLPDQWGFVMISRSRDSPGPPTAARFTGDVSAWETVEAASDFDAAAALAFALLATP